MSDINKLDRDLFTVQDLLAWKPPPRRQIIHGGVLNVGSRLQIFGDEGSWKSHLANHLAHSIARGSNWMGFKTSPANVLSIQGEMNMWEVHERSLQYCVGSKRIYLARHLPDNVSPEELDNIENAAVDYAYPPNVVNRLVQFFHLDDQAGVASLRKQLTLIVTEFPNLPLVLILDPLFKMFRHNLSDEADARYFVDNIDLLLKDFPQLAVTFVHHPRKPSIDKDGVKISAGSDDAFGSRLFNWWSDAIIRTFHDEEDETHTAIDLRFTKHPRTAKGLMPKVISLRWNKDTLHPLIVNRPLARYPDDYIEPRSDAELARLE